MSEHEEGVPLTRRERRMRELAETGALNLSEMAAEAAAPVVSPADEEIEISPLNPDGTPRSRREIRVLREQALAARQAAEPAAADKGTSVEPEPLELTVPLTPSASEAPVAAPVFSEPTATLDAEPVIVEPVEPVEPVEAVPLTVADEPEAAGVAEDFDDIISPPTEPFTVEELREAEASLELEGDALAEAAPEAKEPERVEAEEAGSESSGKSRLKFWKRNKSAETEAVAAPEAPEAEATIDEDVVSSAEAPVSADAVTPDIAEPVEVEAPELSGPESELETMTVAPEVIADAEPVVAEPVLPEPVAPEPVAPEPVAPEPVAPEVPADPAPKDTYSFPDIAPPEEWRSVFDDPATLNVPAQPGETQGDFDDLISRAVAQEGSATGTSALILPTMPEDTGGLTGPLGATGELYVTGSMRLPKSLGETGGHVSLHDSAEIDPITGAESVEDSGAVAGLTPVSARHAVSARVVSGVPAVAKPTKERSKLPLVLGLTGGGLLIVVVGLGVWGATNGMFG